MRKKKISGARRMKMLGYVQSQVWMLPQQNALIYRAAARRGVTKTAFILNAALLAAMKVEE